MNLKKIVGRKLSITLLYSLPAVAYLILFFYIPLITIIIYSFWHGEPLYRITRIFTLENYVRFFTGRTIPERIHIDKSNLNCNLLGNINSSLSYSIFSRQDDI
jgi:ABC-type sugar transport system permease subunit